MLKKIPKQFYYFLLLLFGLNLVQSAFTELIFDEAYYWYFSQEMAWGYFDHPPMVALLIKLSSFFFSGELGVRFMSCVLSSLTILVIWLLIDNPKKNEYIKHFFVLVFSMTLLNAYGFFTLPDTPLLFFTALFLLLYKHFLDKPTWVFSVLLGICMAALMYSKYHAVLVIFFVLLSNLSLLSKKQAWLAVLVALVCYSPHLYWLNEHDYVSIKYHLFERPNGAYGFNKNTLGFLVNLVAIFGLTFPFIYLTLIKTKATNLFNRSLLFLSYGVILFFFISSFSKRVQTQWIIVICIPLAVIAFNYMLNHKSALKWIFRLGLVNAVIILYLRAGLAYQPLLLNFYYESHGNKDWVNAIKDEVGNIPVVFENSYRNAPMYAFYAKGSTSFSLNNVMYRKNQFSINDSEEKVRHKRVGYISKYINDNTFSYEKNDGWVYKGKYIEDFNSYRKLECIVPEKQYSLEQDSTVDFKLYNPYPFPIPLNELRFAVAYLNQYRIPVETILVAIKAKKEDVAVIKSQDTLAFNIQLPKAKKKDISYFRIVISENNLYFGLNGKTVPLE